MAEILWTDNVGWWFALLKWACFLGVWLEASKLIYGILHTRRLGYSLLRSIGSALARQPDKIFVIAILVYYARTLYSTTPEWLLQSPEWIFVNFAYAGYWLTRMLPAVWVCLGRGRRREDGPHTTVRPRPTPVR